MPAEATAHDGFPALPALEIPSRNPAAPPAEDLPARRLVGRLLTVACTVSGRTTPEEAERAVLPNPNHIPSKEGTDMRFTKLLGLFLVALATFLFATPILAQEGRTYETQVTRSDGGQFCDCIEFSEETPGIAQITGIGMALTWAHTDLNEDENGWQAVGPIPGEAPSEPQSGFGVNPGRIAFHGQVKKRGSVITGEAISAIGVTFVLVGEENPECSFSSFVCEAN
jgi:hypothetical protein